MPEIYMDVDEAVVVPVNVFPLTDDTDFKTIEDAVAYDAAGMTLLWNFVTTDGVQTQTAVTPTAGGSYDWSHRGNGMYSIEIPAKGGASINNDAEGFGWFTGKATGVLPWRGPVIGFRASGLNDKLMDDAYSETRGLAGTALPAAAADGAGGLPVSYAGGLDLDAKLANTHEVTAARMAVLTDWIDNGRLDLLLDAIKAQSDKLQFTAGNDLKATLDGETVILTDGSLTADKIAANAIVAAALAADAISRIQNGLMLAAEYTAPDNAGITAIKNKTDNLPADPSSEGTVSAVGAAVTALGTPLQDSAYTPPNNADIAAVKAVTDKLNTAVEADGEVYRFTANALEQSPAGGVAPTAEQIRQEIDANSTKLQTIEGKIDLLSGSTGPGADICTITILSNGVPVPDADVWISSDAAGGNVIAGTLQTDSSGKATFLLDAGVTYYLWMEKDGENPILGKAFVAVAD